MYEWNGGVSKYSSNVWCQCDLLYFSWSSQTLRDVKSLISNMIFTVSRWAYNRNSAIANEKEQIGERQQPLVAYFERLKALKPRPYRLPNQDVTHILLLFMFFGAKHNSSQDSRLTTLILLHPYLIFPLKSRLIMRVSVRSRVCGLVTTSGRCVWCRLLDESSSVFALRGG